MKIESFFPIAIAVVLLGTSAAVLAQDSSPANPKYDAALAKELGADDLGMRSYVFCVLKTGPAKIARTEVASGACCGRSSVTAIDCSAGSQRSSP